MAHVDPYNVKVQVIGGERAVITWEHRGSTGLPVEFSYCALAQGLLDEEDEGVRVLPVPVIVRATAIAARIYTEYDVMDQRLERARQAITVLYVGGLARNADGSVDVDRVIDAVLGERV